MGYYLMFDIGGTNIKAGILDKAGMLLNREICSFPAMSQEGREAVFENFAHIITKMAAKAEDKTSLLGVGMAFPGPFDYKNGISLMKGLDKYDSIYGLKISQEIPRFTEDLHRKESLLNTSFRFLHDVEAFALGVLRSLEVEENTRLLHLCIGTGAGSAFSIGREIVSESVDGVPENGWIYNHPFKEGIIDDYISVRGLRAITLQILGSRLDGAALYEMAEKGDEKARKVFRLFGENLYLAVKDFLDGFSPDGLVLGGQLSKAIDYFGESLALYTRKKGIKIYSEENTSKRIMEGLYTRF